VRCALRCAREEAIGVKFWQSVSGWETDQLLDVARAAERLGLWGITIPSHLFHAGRVSAPYPYTDDGVPPWEASTPWPDPWVLIGAMSTATTRLHFTSGVYVAPVHDPFTVARLVCTAAVLAGPRRVSLGVAAGWCAEEYRYTGQPFKSRGDRLDEMVPVLRALMAGGPVSHHGAWFDFDDVRISPAPAEPVPVYLGGHSDAALRRAARLGDGWVGRIARADELDAVLPRLFAHLDAAGRDRAGFEVIAGLRGRPGPDTYERYAEAGVTGFVCASWASTPRLSTLDDRLAAMARFADRVVRRFT
jgi:probable F420-dependent oxidoreductase